MSARLKDFRRYKMWKNHRKHMVILFTTLILLVPTIILAQKANENAEDFLKKGISYFEEEKFEQALEYFNKSIELNKKNKKAWKYKAYVLNYLNRYAEVVTAWDEYVKIDPKSSAVWVNRGIALYRINKYPEAMLSFDKAIKIDPKAPQIYKNRGTIKFDMGNYKEALADLEQAKNFDYPIDHISGYITTLKRVLRQIEGKDVPPKNWKPDYDTYHTIYEDLRTDDMLVFLMLDKWGDMPQPESGGAVPAGGIPGTKVGFKGSQEEPLSFAPNFYVWDGAYINDTNFGILLEEGTKFKRVIIDGNYKYIRIGVIKNWKTEILSEKKVVVE